MPADSIHSGSVTSTVCAMRFDENPFTFQCEEERKKALGFKFRTVIGRF